MKRRRTRRVVNCRQCLVERGLVSTRPMTLAPVPAPCLKPIYSLVPRWRRGKSRPLPMPREGNAAVKQCLPQEPAGRNFTALGEVPLDDRKVALLGVLAGNAKMRCEFARLRQPHKPSNSAVDK